MLISYEHSFLFIHVPKAAGSSIYLALEPYALRKRDSRLRRRLVWLGAVNRLWGLYRTVDFPRHVTAQAVKRCLPSEVYAGLFKFAFVRNPWDRLVSRYAYLQRTETHNHHRFVKAMSFDEYVPWQIRRQRKFQHTYLTDRRGRWLVDFIGHYERLKEDFATICARLDVQAQLPHTNISSHRDYRSYYTEATRELVARHFRRDIELFGYDFDGLRADRGGLQLSPAA